MMNIHRDPAGSGRGTVRWLRCLAVGPRVKPEDDGEVVAIRELSFRGDEQESFGYLRV
jgi:hypothetical protein